MRVGLISGTFDPIHDGHIAIAQLSFNSLKLDEVWFLPEKSPRNKQNVTDYQHRVDMLDLAIEHKPRMKIVEVSQDSHNLDTLEEVTEHYQENIAHDFFMLFGTDVVRQMQSWQNLTQLETLAKVISIGRNGEAADVTFSHPASSKTIREQISESRHPENLNEKVLEYIYEYKLYQT